MLFFILFFLVAFASDSVHALWFQSVCFDLKVPLAIEGKYARSRWNAANYSPMHRTHHIWSVPFWLESIRMERVNVSISKNDIFFLLRWFSLRFCFSRLEFHSLHFKRSTYSTTLSLFTSHVAINRFNYLITRAHCTYSTVWHRGCLPLQDKLKQ